MKTLAGLILAVSACLLLSCAHPQRAVSAERTGAAFMSDAFKPADTQTFAPIVDDAWTGN
jgi:hypothetical protein